jgi:hypothetical protein
MRHTRWAAPLLSVALLTAAALPAGAVGDRAPKPTAADAAILKAGLVTAADVPAGWTASTQLDTGAKGYRGIPSCQPIYAAVTAARRAVPHRLSSDFSPRGSANTVTVVDDIVLAFKTPAAASRFLSAFAGPTVPDCLERVLTKSAKAKAQVSVAQLDDLQGVGDTSVGYEASITASNNGQSLSLVGDIITVGVGRAVALVSYLNDGSVTLPEGIGVVNAVVDRLRFTPTG